MAENLLPDDAVPLALQALARKNVPEKAYRCYIFYSLIHPKLPCAIHAGLRKTKLQAAEDLVFDCLHRVRVVLETQQEFLSEALLVHLLDCNDRLQYIACNGPSAETVDMVLSDLESTLNHYGISEDCGIEEVSLTLAETRRRDDDVAWLQDLVDHPDQEEDTGYGDTE